MGMSLQDIQKELGRLATLEAALLDQRGRMTNEDKIKQLEAAQPHVLPETVEAEALLQSGYGFTVKECEAIIKERKEDPVRWPLEEARKAQAMLDAYHAKKREPSSKRQGWHRTRGV